MPTVATRAERQAQTRADLIDAAERLFTAQGFAATTLDEVARDAGYTKGAVYSNFSSKEDVFFAVYERRVDRHLAAVEAAIAQAGEPLAGTFEVVRAAAERRESDDGWLAAFLEFWTHVLRHPEHRARFAQVHARAAEPFVAAVEGLATQRGIELALPPRLLAIAGFALGTGLGLERLTQPDAVDKDAVVAVQRLWLDLTTQGAKDGSVL
jgi:AcrR family transcriptional regulator